MKIAFVTNICAHYNVGTFEELSRHHDVDYYFFSAGREWYWQKQHGYRFGNFHAEYLPGFQIGYTRVTPSLPWKLIQKNYDIYIKCINGRFAQPVTYFAALLRRKPFILWTGIWTRLQTPMHKRIFPMTRYIYRHSDAIVVYGSHVREYLVMEGVDPRKIFIAWHATDNEFYGRTVPSMEREEMRSALKIPPGKKVVLYLGRLEESKGVEFLIRAFARLNRDDSILVLAGTGSAQNNLEGLSRELGIHQNVRFAGYVPIETAPRYYAIAYIYVLPSITTAAGREPWGLVVNEAFNQGVPVIATDAVGAVVGGLVQEDVNGLIVPEKNENALASALMRILDDPDLCNRMGENAKRIVQEWNYKRNVAGYLGAIKYILESG